jgi:protein SCO1/2
MTPVRALAILLTLIASSCGGPHAESAASPGKGVDARAGRPGPPNRPSLIREQHLANIELTTHEGRTVRFYDDLVKGKVVAINFMYTTCVDKCPVAIDNLLAVEKALGERMGRDVTLLSISLDAERDTPPVLRQYARLHGTGPGWYFLTGRRDEIERLRRKLGAYELDPILDADRSQHAGIIILGNEPQGRWRAISALSKPVRIRQAIERTLLPPNRWPTGDAVVTEVPYEVREAIETPDLSDVRVIK